MFSLTYGAQHTKLKAHLRLAVSRLKTVGKKKAEANNKAKAEIAQLLAENKQDRARIRVEHIIREDNLIEAYEMLELFCELLLTRYGVIEHKKELDSSISEAVLSILWAVPRMATDIPEFKVLGTQFTMKYGKDIAQAAIDNKLEAPLEVSPVLLKKVSICTPEKILRERYLIVIAQKYNVDFKPDLELVGEDEVSLGEMMLAEFCAAKPQPTAPDVVEGKHDIGWKCLPKNTHLSVENPNFSNLLDTSINSLVTDSKNQPEDHNKPTTMDDSYFDKMMMKLTPAKTASEIEFEDLMRRFDHLKKRSPISPIDTLRVQEKLHAERVLHFASTDRMLRLPATARDRALIIDMVSIDFTKEWEMSDVVLKTMDSDELLYANKTILAVFSPFFKTLFGSDTGSNAELKQGVINLEDICYWPMLEILKVIHNIERRFDAVNLSYTVDQIVQLWRTAEKLDSLLIRQLCKHGICLLNRTDALDVVIQCGFHQEKAGILRGMTYAEIQIYLSRGTNDLVFSPADAQVIAGKYAGGQQYITTVAQAAPTFTLVIFSIDFTKEWEMSDVALKTRDSEELLFGNRAILAVHSPFFKQLFDESKEDAVNLDGIDYWPMLEILKIIHSANRQFNAVYPLYTLTELIQLWQAADGYDFPMIRELCKQQILKLKPAEGLEWRIQCGLHDEKSETLKNMNFDDIRKYLDKGMTELVLSPADAMVIIEKRMEVEKIVMEQAVQAEKRTSEQALQAEKAASAQALQNEKAASALALQDLKSKRLTNCPRCHQNTITNQGNGTYHCRSCNAYYIP